MEKLIITAAICGAEVTKEQNPAVPYTVKEMVREAKSAYDAGAAVIHVHVREDDGTPTQSKKRFKEVLDAIYKEIPDVLVIPSTGGAVGMSAEERLQPTELFPEMATLDCGTCNFGDDVFENTIPMMREFGKRMLDLNTNALKWGIWIPFFAWHKRDRFPAHQCSSISFWVCLAVPLPPVKILLGWYATYRKAQLGPQPVSVGISSRSLWRLFLWAVTYVWDLKIICIYPKACLPNPTAN